jgi:hypothetical protein
MAKTKAIFYRMKSSGSRVLIPYTDTDDSATQADIDSIALGHGFVDTALAGQPVAYAESINPIVYNVDGSTIMRVNNTVIWEDEPSAVTTDKHVFIPGPVVASATALHAAVTNTGSTIHVTPTAQPDVPRAIVATPGGVTGNVTAVGVLATGFSGSNSTGVAISETLPSFTAGQATAVTSVNAFGTVTDIAQPNIGTGVTVAYGTSPKLGLGVALPRNTVLKTFLNNTLEGTAPTVTTNSTTASKNLIQLNSTLNGTNVDVYLLQG